MRKAKGNIRKMLAAIVLTLLCGSAFAQRIVESGWKIQCKLPPKTKVILPP